MEPSFDNAFLDGLFDLLFDDGFFSPFTIGLFLMVTVISIALRIWGYQRGREKGYGRIVSLNEDPFLLNEIPARDDSAAEHEATRKVVEEVLEERGVATDDDAPTKRA